MVRYRSVLALISLGYVGGALSNDRPQIIQFESPFPGSSYKNVYALCMHTWHGVRLAKTVTMDERQRQQFNYWLIDSLMSLHNNVVSIIDDADSCSPDDVEYLVGILHVMHVEYMAAQHKKLNEEALCCSVLFGFIKSKLEKLLA